MVFDSPAMRKARKWYLTLILTANEAICRMFRASSAQKDLLSQFSHFALLRGLR